MTPQLSSIKDYERYGRQMILDGFGLPGQLKLQLSSVVVIGAGGLGCPALQYLAASGIGRIGIVDHDIVELSNLQRQILHSEQTIGMSKAESAAQALRRLNSQLVLDVISVALTAENAVPTLEPYDIILDCTDNAPTRYLLSDTAVALGKPLVSGAAQRYDGQLCTYNLGMDGPCYRCLFPNPPPREISGSCEEMGILGVVTGIIGSMQALEAIKILTDIDHSLEPSLILFSVLGRPQFRTIKLRSRKRFCPACAPELDRYGNINKTDYIQFCGGVVPDWEQNGLAQGKSNERMAARELRDMLNANMTPYIIDVRSTTEFGICRLPESINVPLSDLLANPAHHIPLDKSIDTYVVCRLGNDSQIAADALRKVEGVGIVRDVIGGLRAWSKQVDAEFPIY